MKNIIELPSKKKYNADKILEKAFKKFSVLYGPEQAKRIIEIIKETTPPENIGTYIFQFSFDEKVDRISDESKVRFEEALREYTRQCVDNIFKLSRVISNLKIENMRLKVQLGIPSDT